MSGHSEKNAPQLPSREYAKKAAAYAKDPTSSTPPTGWSSYLRDHHREAPPPPDSGTESAHNTPNLCRKIPVSIDYMHKTGANPTYGCPVQSNPEGIVLSISELQIYGTAQEPDQ